MSKHTPGPWEISGCTIIPGTLYVYSKKGEYLAKVLHENDKKCQANARLIAAAPKMYELLDKLRNVINDTCEHGNHSSGLMTVWNTMANDGMDLLDEIDGEEGSNE